MQKQTQTGKDRMQMTKDQDPGQAKEGFLVPGGGSGQMRIFDEVKTISVIG